MTSADKRSLRALACEARDRLSASERAAAAEAVAARLAAMPELAGARLVLGYAAMEGELDCAAALARLAAAGARIAYPRVEGPETLSLRVAAPADLVRGTFGIPEPPADAPVAGPGEIDAALVPGVAFDAACCRLGHGAGYYDRLLPLLRGDAAVIGLAFDEQVLEWLPREDHDVPMDAVVTPSAVYRAS